jgi:hypothetical protein
MLASSLSSPSLEPVSCAPPAQAFIDHHADVPSLLIVTSGVFANEKAITGRIPGSYVFQVVSPVAGQSFAPPSRSPLEALILSKYPPNWNNGYTIRITEANDNVTLGKDGLWIVGILEVKVNPCAIRSSPSRLVLERFFSPMSSEFEIERLALNSRLPALARVSCDFRFYNVAHYLGSGQLSVGVSLLELRAVRARVDILIERGTRNEVAEAMVTLEATITELDARNVKTADEINLLDDVLSPRKMRRGLNGNVFPVV